ncbi:DUF1190 domain-containing protein [Novispirillum sp. DQ9]|uniref:DUF1190 domain-containing protein n=1 Tax=Novispirillum sp. DQ9 TaxID=3398612 RepID=UPI003C7C3081
MKRSRRVALTGLMASTALALAACGEEEVPVEAYTTVEQCVADGLFDREACQGMLSQAMEVHAQAAPRYANEALCEEEFGPGQCAYQPTAGQGENQQAGGGGFFMPLFMGYMAGRMLGGGSALPANLQRTYKGQSYGVQPYYRTRDGRFTGVTGSPLSVGRDGATAPKSTFTTPPRTPQVATRTTVRTTGGFGGRAFGFGG